MINADELNSRSSDSLALVSIKAINTKSSIDWDFNSSIESWSGVTMRDGRIVKLQLGSLDLVNLPTSIGELDSLVSALNLPIGQLCSYYNRGNFVVVMSHLNSTFNYIAQNKLIIGE